MADTCISTKVSVRRALKDLGPNFKVPDDEIYRHMEAAQNRIIATRPDASVDRDADGLVSDAVPSPDDTADLGVIENFTPAVEHYVLAQVFTHNTHYANSEAANNHHKAFYELLGY